MDNKSSKSLKDFISRHDVVYESAPEIWPDGFPIGNGHFGAMVYQPEGLELGISKLDVWDRRHNEINKVPFDKIKNLADGDSDSNSNKILDMLDGERPESAVPWPSPKPCGKLKLDIEQYMIPLDSTVVEKSQTLRLFDATAVCNYELNQKRTETQCYVAPDSNLLAVHAKDTWLDKSLRTVERTRKLSLTIDYDENVSNPETGVDGNVLWIRRRFPDGFEYVIALVINGAEYTKPVCFPNEVRTRISMDYRDGQPGDYHILLAVATSDDAEDPLSEAKSILRRACESGIEKFRDRQRKWWADFWSRSWIQMDDEFLETMWYVSLYLFASTSRGKVAPGLMGLWSQLDNPPWHGDYHGDINLAMTYWSIFSSNHIELGEPYFSTIKNMLPAIKKETMEYYGVDGAKYPTATSGNGYEICHGRFRTMLCAGAFYGLIYWQHYLYTKDEEFLKNVSFEVLEETSKFYLEMSEERDGTLFIGPSLSPEQGPICYNSTNDIALIKPLWKAYIKACRCLNRTSGYADKIEKYLDIFPAYPVKDDMFLDSYSVDEHIPLNHPGLLAMVVPGEEVDMDHPLKSVAINTMKNYFNISARRGFDGRKNFIDDLTWMWLACIAVKLGQADLADEVLFNNGVSEYLKPNGLFSISPGGRFDSVEEKRGAFKDHVNPHSMLYWSSVNDSGKRKQVSFVETSSALVYLVNEMMLQSQGEIIRIFPALPKRIGTASFKDLRAQGGYIVSASKNGDGIKFVSIHSSLGGKCKIKLPLDQREKLYLKTDGATCEKVEMTDGLLEFDTKANCNYVISADRDEQGQINPEMIKSHNIVKKYKDKYGKICTIGSQ